jgi:hypothetical protein
MPLPVLPLSAGLAGVAAGTALHYWLTEQADPWEDHKVFNARMRDMHTLALALNDGFSTCPAFQMSMPQLTAWRGARDNFSKFYSDVGTLHFDPSTEEVEQAKSYASKFYFWTGEYNRLKCGSPLSPTTQVDPYAPPSPPPIPTSTDWTGIIKWSAIGLGGLFAIKTISDLFRTFRR